MDSVLNIFQNDAFGMATMTAAIETSDHVPEELEKEGLFTPNPIREIVVGVEMRDNTLSLIKTTKRGDNLQQRTEGKRKKLFFETSRVGLSDKIHAHELAFIHKFDQPVQVQAAQDEIARRLNGPSGLLNYIRTTHENMRLGALNGILLDADGSVIYNFYDEFNIVENPEITFTMSMENGDFEQFITANVVRPMQRRARGARFSYIKAKCGSNFFDNLIKNKEVRESRKNRREDGQDTQGSMGREFWFAGILWKEYHGTDDGTTVDVGPDKVKFYPAGEGNGIFEHVQSPGESFADLGELGKNIYAEINLDPRERARFAELEAISYPLFLNKRPDMIFKGSL